jgi:hypothetical protein
MATKKEEMAAKRNMATIVEATKAGSFVSLALAIATILVELGLAEVNPNGPNAEGNIDTRATVAGIEFVDGKPVAEEKPGFVLETGIVPPAAKRTGRAASSLYPFDKMEAGQSFFVPATEAKPEPAKSLASTVSSATARFAELVTNEDGSPKMKINRKKKEVQETKNTRVFIVREVEENGVKGARVFRTA